MYVWNKGILVQNRRRFLRSFSMFLRRMMTQSEMKLSMSILNRNLLCKKKRKRKKSIFSQFQWFPKFERKIVEGFFRHFYSFLPSTMMLLIMKLLETISNRNLLYKYMKSVSFQWKKEIRKRHRCQLHFQCFIQKRKKILQYNKTRSKRLLIGRIGRVLL